jgi:hypothetical protein
MRANANASAMIITTTIIMIFSHAIHALFSVSSLCSSGGGGGYGVWWR